MQLQNLCARFSKKSFIFYIACVLLTLGLVSFEEETKIFVFCIGLFSISAFTLSFFSEKSRSKPLWGVFAVTGSTVLTAVASALIYHTSVLHDYEFSSLLLPAGLLRIYLLFWPISILNGYVVFDTARVSDFLFRHRWKLAIFFAFVLIIAKVHFYSVSCFSFYIQPEHETAFTMPLFGTPRTIRSDEWMVNVPRNIVSGYSGYEKFNYILRGTENYNIASSGLYLSYSALSNVFNLGYYLFGSEYGLSFFTVTCFVFTIMIAFEFSYIIAQKKRLPALLGACLIGLSQFSLWWSMVLQIPALLTIIVCAHYFFETDNRYYKTFFAIGIALAGAMFICNLYPAWQVPFAYIILSLLMWVFTSHWNSVKALRKKDWYIIFGAFVFMCSVVLSYLNNNQAYFAAVIATEYPGTRFSTGGYAIDKLLSYPASLLYPFKDTGNNSEAATFFSLFPLPVIFSVWILLKDAYGCVKKEKSCDIFVLWIMVPMVFFFVYCTVGIPEFLAKYTLMSYSFNYRAADALDLLNVFLLIRILGIDKDRYKWPTEIGFVIIVAALLWAINTTEMKFAHFMSAEYIVCIAICILLFGIAVFCQIDESKRTRILLSVIAVIAIPGLSVLPVTRGLDSVLKKPVSIAIQEIVKEKPDAKWIAIGEFEPPQFLVSNGAPTINSNNYIPNMELWKKLDPDNDDHAIYNRYSHVDIVLTEGATDFELIAPDWIRVILSYSDLKTAEVQYIFSIRPLLEESDIVEFDLLYEEAGTYIYEVIYCE